MDSLSIELVLIAIGIFANGVFAGSEIALVSSRPSRLAELRQGGARGAAAAMQLKRTPETFLATIQIAITAVGTLTSVVGGAAAVEALSPWLASAGLGAAAHTVALGIVVLVITYASLVIGELTPKAIALRDPERFAGLVAPMMAVISRVSAPIVRVLSVSTNLVLRILGVGPAQESPFVSEEEVRYLVREGARQGIFEKVEEELVHRVFEFADTTVREIMTPRPQITGLDVATPPEAVLAKAVEIGRSRMPVYEGSVEATLGVLTLRDLLGAVLADGSVVVEGMTPVDEVRRHLGIRLPESHDYTTVAGLLLATMNAVPARGASVVIAGRRWTVLEMEGPRIRRVSVRPETGQSV